MTHITRPAKRMALLAAAVACLGMAAACGGNNYVDELTLVNPTSYPVDVEVTDGGRTGWVGVGTAPANGERLVEQVLHQGGTWVFRFRSAGRELGEVEMTESELAQNQWRVQVPESAEERLQEEGVEPPPDLEGDTPTESAPELEPEPQGAE